jgi:hypothetical protein
MSLTDPDMAICRSVQSLANQDVTCLGARNVNFAAVTSVVSAWPGSFTHGCIKTKAKTYWRQTAKLSLYHALRAPEMNLSKSALARSKTEHIRIRSKSNALEA